MRVSSRTRRSTDLRIYQANVNHSSPCHDSALSLAYNNNYDIIALQEPWVHPDLSKRRTKSHPNYQAYAPLSQWTSRPRVLFYARKSLTPFIIQSYTDQSRDLIDITIRDSSLNTPLLLLNIYNAPRGATDPGEGLRQLLLTSDVDHPTCHPALVCGDFNIRHADWDSSTGHTPQEGDDLLRWTQAHNLSLRNPLAAATHNRGGTLDLVFTKNPGAECVVATDLHTGSDHETIVCTIPRSKTLPLQKGKLRYQACDDDILLCFLRPHTRPVSDDPEVEATALVSTLRDALITACPRATGHGGNAPWWNADCAAAHHRYKVARRTGYSQLEQKQFLDTIRRSKRNHWRSLVANAESPKDVFNITRWHKLEPSYQSPSLRRADGSLATSPEEKTDVLYHSLLTRELEFEDIPLDCPTVSRNRIVLPRFEAEEVYDAVCRVSSTTPGLDEIPASTLRKAWPILGPRIVTLFQCCYDQGIHPSAFKQANVVILGKSGRRDRTLPRSYRPISLLSCLGKGLERLLARRLSHLSMQMQLLGADQCSAVSKRSAVDLTTALACDIQSAWDEKMVAGIVTLDIKGAFDGIARTRLVNRLKEQGWPEQLLKWTTSFMSNRSASIRLDGQHSQMRELRCGLPQGSPISPILFLLFVEPLLKLTGNRFGYADDVCLFARGKTLEDVQRRLQFSLDLSLRWGREHGVTFETSKTELQYFHRKRTYAEPNLSMEQHDVTANDSTRWLGMVFDRKLQFKDHLKMARTRARQVTDHLARLCGTSYGASPALLRLAVQSCAFSTLLYAAETWYSRSTTQQAIGQLQVVMNRGARAVLPVYRTTPAAVLMRETGWGSAEAWLNRIRNRYVTRVAAADPRHPMRRRWNSSRFRWSRREIDIELAIPSSTPPWDPMNRDLHRTEIGAVGRAAGAEAFRIWANDSTSANPLDLTIYSDGSLVNGSAGAGFATFRGNGSTKEMLHHGMIPLGDSVEVYDAEIVGAVAGLRAAHENPWSPFQGNVTIVLDNEEAAIRLSSGIRTASSSNELAAFCLLRQQWANGAFSGTRRRVTVRWCPGHSSIDGNEIADDLAKAACQATPAFQRPMTIARAKRHVKNLFVTHVESFWDASAPQRYRDLGIKMTPRAPQELKLPRRHLARLLAARTGHGDFSRYHERFGHEEYRANCLCGHQKTPEHFIFCARGRRRGRIATPRMTCVEGRLKWILGTPEGAKNFARWCEETSFYEVIQR